VFEVFNDQWYVGSVNWRFEDYNSDFKFNDMGPVFTPSDYEALVAALWSPAIRTPRLPLGFRFARLDDEGSEAR
jgi:hypothetical protein